MLVTAGKGGKHAAESHWSLVALGRLAGDRKGMGESEGHEDADSGKPDSEVCRYRVTGHENHPGM